MVNRNPKPVTNLVCLLHALQAQKNTKQILITSIYNLMTLIIYVWQLKFVSKKFGVGVKCKKTKDTK